jgi:ribosomal protein L37AE/L43A
MAIDGHAPTTGLGNRIHLLANEICPDCRSKYNSKMAAPDLSRAADGILVCPECDGHFNLGGVGE